MVCGGWEGKGKGKGKEKGKKNGFITDFSQKGICLLLCVLVQRKGSFLLFFLTQKNLTNQTERCHR